MAPGRRRGAGKGSTAAAARHQWKPGDLVLAKVKGYPAWPATVSEPQKWGYSRDWKKVLVYFFGTYQIAFCNPSDVEPFTEDKKSSLLIKCQGKGADFVRAVDEIIEMAEKMKESRADEVESGNDGVVSDVGVSQVATSCADNSDVKANPCLKLPSLSEAQSDIFMEIDSYASAEASEPRIGPAELLDTCLVSGEHILNDGGPNQTEQLPFLAGKFSRKRSRNISVQTSSLSRHFLSAQHCNTSSEDLEPKKPSLVEEDSDGSYPQLRLEGFGPEKMNNVARKLSGELAKKGTDSSAITQSLSNKLDISDSDKHPNNSYFNLSYSPTSFVAIESSSGSRSGIAIKRGACTFDIDNNCTNEKNEVSELIGESSDKGTEVSSMLPLSDLGMSKVCLALDDGQVKTAVFKKKRKPHKKRALLDTLESSQQIPLSTGCKGSPLWSPDTCFKANEHFVVVNGDEHLPLVKRARVRMEKPLKDESEQCSLDAAEKNSTEDQGNFLSLATLSRAGDAHMSISSTIGDKESSTSLSVSMDNLKPKENGACLPWKAKKYHLIGSVDNEASLPPSKRLHRALEAMSANVAEAAETSIKVQGVKHHQQASEVHSSSGIDIVENNTHNPSVDGSVDSLETPIGLMFQKPHVHVRLITDASEPSASEPPGLPVETCSEEKLHDYNVKGHDGSLHEAIMVADDKGEKIEGSFCSDTHETCSLTESKLSSTSVQGVSVDSSSPRRHGSTDPMLPTESGSALTVDTVEVNRSCENFRKGLSENTETPKVHPVGQCQPEHPILQEGNYVPLEKGNGDSLHVMARPEEDSCTSSTKHGNSVVSLKPQIEEGTDLTSRNEARDGLELTPRVENVDLVSELIPMRGLIFAAQSKAELSHSGSLNRHSPLAEERTADCFASSQSAPACEALHHKASAMPDDGKHQFFINSRMSPDASSLHTFNVEDKPRPSCAEKSLDRAIENAKSSSVLKSFEAMLFTLSRTKDSIGRATRVAIDCAKYGIAKEVVDILLRYLESEPSLHRKVDLFFLVDSIIQCSRGQKGIAGESYSFAVQAVLPRLISAAVPPGTAARENHRQCLKVLRLWLERKTLPESVVRKHMQELEALSDSWILPRRTLRTERALNDPLREMEGMLVDEYGSNTSLQISGFTMPRLLEDEEEISATDGKSIAAMPPVEACKSLEESKEIAKPASEKHRHILEDVDGELEMEDVSPSCETEISASDVPRSENTLSSITQFDKCHSLPVDLPPLPEEIPPSPPPLPSSPPPPAVQPSSCPLPPLPVQSSISHCFVEPELHCAHKNLVYEQNYQGQLQQQFVQQQAVGHASSSHLDAVPHSCSGSMDPQIRMQNIGPFGSPGPYSGSHSALLTVQTGNNIQPIIGPRLPNKNFHVRPPTCAVSNQFSFLHSEPQQRFQPWLESSSSSFQGPSQLMHSRPREHFSNDMGRMENMQDQVDGGCRFAANNHAGPHKTEHMYSHPSSHYGPNEHQNRWQSLPLVGMDYHQNSQSFNHPPLQRQISGVSGNPGPSVWRPT
ncbi:ENHANCER OF AG-4 protein 2-like isoform X1 [Nymphaea colorata]|nr:ENHANCER OF AG-4 protein 2-like isoform X1 [Nymphaea colorata]